MYDSLLQRRARSDGYSEIGCRVSPHGHYFSRIEPEKETTMRKFLKSKLVIHIFMALTFAVAARTWGDDIRVGIIGLDTSHATAFTRLMNDPNAKGHIPGAKVVAAFKGGSDDIESSYSRVDGITEELQRDFGVKIVPTIEELCTMVDAVLLESVDGRPHLEQVKPVFAAGLPVFIDKPVAGTLKDAIEIYKLGKTHDVPWFSSSSYRFYKSMTDLMKEDVGEIRGAISYGPCYLEPTHPDLFWYGVHPAEALFTALGTGCETVVRTSMPDTDVVTGIWSGGRVGTFRGLRNAATPHQVILFGTKKVAAQDGGGNYAPLVVEIVKFFQTKVAPVSPEETVEIFAFMEAADESKRRGGTPVSIQEVITKAGG
jgi:Oxidoreductase family, NAD-binding Rossmann fold